MSLNNINNVFIKSIENNYDFSMFTDEEKKSIILNSYDKIKKCNDSIYKLNSIIQKTHDQITVLKKYFFHNSLNEFILNSNYKIIDFIPSKEKISGCYFLYQNEQIIYVGISVDINKRLLQHKFDKVWDCVKYIPTNDFLEVIKLESYFINKYKPKFNLDLGGYEERAIRHYYNIIDDKINYDKGWPDKIIGETLRSNYKPKKYNF